MYNSTKVAENIKIIAKTKNIQLRVMFDDLELNKNTLSNMYKGSFLKSDNLARIADYLECSVDYLLGRTDTQSIRSNISPPVSFQVSEVEKTLVITYRSVNEQGREKIIDYAEDIAGSDKYKKDNQHRLVAKTS